jgi:hypothetical protein
MFSSSAIFFYFIVPENRSADPTKSLVIKSQSVTDLIFLQSLLKITADINIGHDNWKIGADTILDVEQVCRNQEYSENGRTVFDNILNSFGINMTLFYGMNLNIRTYKQYYKQYYDAYFNSLSKSKQKEPPAAMYYNAFTKAVNEYINIEKKRGSIILKVTK